MSHLVPLLEFNQYLQIVFGWGFSPGAVSRVFAPLNSVSSRFSDQRISVSFCDAIRSRALEGRTLTPTPTIRRQRGTYP